MPLHKSRPQVRQQSCGRNIAPASGIGSFSPTISDKSSQAARMAQQLASQNNWGETYVPGTPATNATPTESVAELDASEPPPSYEDARLERDLPAIPQASQENVRQEPSRPIEVPVSDPSRDAEIGSSTPLLSRSSKVVKARRRKQKIFILVCIVLAISLMGMQAFKGITTGFWRLDGTPIPPIPNRNTVRHETSQAITGTFTFFDGLDLSTTSGSINIVIDPKPSDQIGIIKLTSNSGSIKVRFADEYMKGFTASGILDRTYNFEIHSSSGSQTIELPLGNGGSVSMTSDSGSQNSKFYMANLGKNTNLTSLTTQSSSGSQTHKVKSISSEPITTLVAHHYVKGSASIRLGLPSVWEGMVHASSGGYGNVDVKGDNLEFQHNGNKEIYAWRVRRDGKAPGTGQVVEARGDGSGSIKIDCSSS